MATPAANPTPEQQQPAKPKWIGNVAACASLLCTLAFWAGFVLSYFPGKIRLNLNGINWLRVMAGAIFLAAVARLFRARSWKVVLGVAMVTAFFAMYIAGS